MNTLPIGPSRGFLSHALLRLQITTFLRLSIFYPASSLDVRRLFLRSPLQNTTSIRTHRARRSIICFLKVALAFRLLREAHFAIPNSKLSKTPPKLSRLPYSLTIPRRDGLGPSLLKHIYHLPLPILSPVLRSPCLFGSHATLIPLFTPVFCLTTIDSFFFFTSHDRPHVPHTFDVVLVPGLVS